MPIHFSIGFVTESRPKRAYVAACAGFTDEVQVSARCVNIIEIKAIWPREEECK